jgi:hypothetical protein
MSGMLAALCSHYYKLTVKVEKRDEHYLQLCEDALTFNLNVTVDEVDEIIDSKLKLVKAFESYQVTFEKWKETEKKILNILKQLGIRPRWTLAGKIPGELEYWVWYDLKDNVHIMKTWDLEPEPPNPNIITIKMAPFLDEDGSVMKRGDEDEDDEDTRDNDEETRKLIKEHHQWMKEQGYVKDE